MLRMAQKRSWDSHKGLRVSFLLRKFLRPILYKHPGLGCNGGYGNHVLTSVLAEDKPHRHLGKGPEAEFWGCESRKKMPARSKKPHGLQPHCSTGFKPFVSLARILNPLEISMDERFAQFS